MEKKERKKIHGVTTLKGVLNLPSVFLHMIGSSLLPGGSFSSFVVGVLQLVPCCLVAVLQLVSCCLVSVVL